VLVEFKSIELAKIARFVDAHDDGLQKAVEAPHYLLRRELGEVPGTDGALDGLEDRILSDSLIAAEQ
jgi:hypothetical protein